MAKTTKKNKAKKTERRKLFYSVMGGFICDGKDIAPRAGDLLAGDPIFFPAMNRVLQYFRLQYGELVKPFHPDTKKGWYKLVGLSSERKSQMLNLEESKYALSKIMEALEIGTPGLNYDNLKAAADRHQKRIDELEAAQQPSDEEF